MIDVALNHDVVLVEHLLELEELSADFHHDSVERGKGLRVEIVAIARQKQKLVGLVVRQEQLIILERNPYHLVGDLLHVAELVVNFLAEAHNL